MFRISTMDITFIPKNKICQSISNDHKSIHSENIGNINLNIIKRHTFKKVSLFLSRGPIALKRTSKNLLRVVLFKEQKD